MHVTSIRQVQYYKVISSSPPPPPQVGNDRRNLNIEAEDATAVNDATAPDELAVIDGDDADADISAPVAAPASSADPPVAKIQAQTMTFDIDDVSMVKYQM